MDLFICFEIEPLKAILNQEKLKLRILRWSQVVSITGLSKSTIKRLEKEGRFPRRRAISSGGVGWLDQEVIEWVKSTPLKSVQEAQRRKHGGLGPAQGINIDTGEGQ